MRIDACKNFLANHPLKPPYIQPLQTTPADEQLEEVTVEPASDNVETTSSHHQPTNSDSPQNLSQLEKHLGGELPITPQKASEMAPEKVVLESPQHHQPNSQIAPTNCLELIIHPKFKPYHLSATHSNISFAIAVTPRNPNIKISIYYQS